MNRPPPRSTLFPYTTLFRSNRRLSPEWVRFIERINEAQLRVLAVDTPSGLNGDSGEPEGAAIRASMTLTVGAAKKGLLRSEEHTSELQSHVNLVCRLLLEKK